MKLAVMRLLGAAVIALCAWAATAAPPAARYAIGTVVGLPSFALIIVGRRQLGASFAVAPKAIALVTTGLYSRIEHPLYFFLDLFLAAAIVAAGLPIALAAWGLLVIVHVYESHREEKVLAAAFGKEYEEYRKRTWF